MQNWSNCVFNLIRGKIVIPEWYTAKTSQTIRVLKFAKVKYDNLCIPRLLVFLERLDHVSFTLWGRNKIEKTTLYNTVL